MFCLSLSLTLAWLLSFFLSVSLSSLSYFSVYLFRRYEIQESNLPKINSETSTWTVSSRFKFMWRNSGMFVHPFMPNLMWRISIMFVHPFMPNSKRAGSTPDPLPRASLLSRTTAPACRATGSVQQWHISASSNKNRNWITFLFASLVSGQNGDIAWWWDGNESCIDYTSEEMYYMVRINECLFHSRLNYLIFLPSLFICFYNSFFLIWLFTCKLELTVFLMDLRIAEVLLNFLVQI
jgi:hypothetical protein